MWTLWCGRTLAVVLCISPEGTDLRAGRPCLFAYLCFQACLVLCERWWQRLTYVGASLGVVHHTRPIHYDRCMAAGHVRCINADTLCGYKSSYAFAPAADEIERVDSALGEIASMSP